MSEKSVRVVLVDDHAVVRSGLAQLLGGVDDIDVVGQAGTGEEALGVVRETRPDVVVMDLQMPGVDGVEATRRLLAEELGCEVLVLTSFSDHARIVAALDAGAVGYLLKDADPEEVIGGVRAVSRGESPLNPRVARQHRRQRAHEAGAAAEHAEQIRERLMGPRPPRRRMLRRHRARCEVGDTVRQPEIELDRVPQRERKMSSVSFTPWP